MGSFTEKNKKSGVFYFIVVRTTFVFSFFFFIKTMSFNCIWGFFSYMTQLTFLFVEDAGFSRGYN